MKLRRLAVILLVLIPFQSLTGYSFTAKFKQTITKNDQPQIHREIAIQDSFFAITTESPAGHSKVLKNASGAFSLTENISFPMPNYLAEEMSMNYLANYSRYLEEVRAVKTGAEFLEGRECDIYWYRSPKGDHPTKVWVWKERNFPLKEITETEGGSWVTEYYEIEFPERLDEDIFKVPSSTTSIFSEKSLETL